MTIEIATADLRTYRSRFDSAARRVLQDQAAGRGADKSDVERCNRYGRQVLRLEGLLGIPQA